MNIKSLYRKVSDAVTVVMRSCTPHAFRAQPVLNDWLGSAEVDPDLKRRPGILSHIYTEDNIDELKKFLVVHDRFEVRIDWETVYTHDDLFDDKYMLSVFPASICLYLRAVNRPFWNDPVYGKSYKEIKPHSVSSAVSR